MAMGESSRVTEAKAPARVREALGSERAAIAECLSRAFEDDPVSRYLFPKDRSRLSRLTSFYRVVLGMVSAHGAIYADEQLRGAAVWRAPSPPRVSAMHATRDALGMLATLRGSMSRAMNLDRIVSAARPTTPHWYLAILGTEPALQGRGVGSALLAPVLACCDDKDFPAYLESSKAENVAFYERHGFRGTGELQIPGGPSLWPMVREPRRPGPEGKALEA